MRYTMLLLLALVCGCGGEKRATGKVPVPFDQVPEAVLKAAKEKLPDVQFNKAMRKPDGVYEIQGKNKQGKVREVEVSPSGEVVGVE